MNVYETKEMGALLASNRYPGRGIVLGLTPDGKEPHYLPPWPPAGPGADRDQR